MCGSTSPSPDCGHSSGEELTGFKLLKVLPYSGVTLHFHLILLTDHGVELFDVAGGHRFLICKPSAHRQQDEHWMCIEIVDQL